MPESAQTQRKQMDKYGTSSIARRDFVKTFSTTDVLLGTKIAFTVFISARKSVESVSILRLVCFATI